MDLSQLELGDVGRLTILDNAGNETDAIFILAGPGHEAREASERDGWRAAARRYNRRGKAEIPEDPDVIWDKETDRLVALTLGWENVMQNGQPLPFSKQAVRAFYDNKRLTVRAQVQKAIEAGEVFTKSSASS